MFDPTPENAELFERFVRRAFEFHQIGYLDTDHATAEILRVTTGEESDPEAAVDYMRKKLNDA